jgi:hypothetical protein
MENRSLKLRSSKNQLEEYDAAEDEGEDNEGGVDVMIAAASDLAVFWIAITPIGHLRAERYPHHIPFFRVRR